ncbi:hypothetical protein ACQ4PT_023282 [Festuca glaucescens]
MTRDCQSVTYIDVRKSSGWAFSPNTSSRNRGYSPDHQIMEVETPAQTQRREQQQLTSGDGAAVAAKPLHRNPRLVVSFLLMVVGSASSLLLLRAYFLHGGNRKWFSSLLQTAGCPLLLAPLCASFISRRRCSATTPVFLMSPQLQATSVGVGLMTGLISLLYAYGTAYLSVSTSSILSSTQLAFTAVFALLLVRQWFTPFSVNAVVLLSVGAVMLGMNAGGDRPTGVSRAQHSAGFAIMLGAAACTGS